MSTATKPGHPALCPLPDPSKSFAEQDEIVLLAMCVFGEARGDTVQAKVGVGSVIRNRLRQHWMGAKTWADVMLKPWQFDCFLANDPNSKKLLTPLHYEAAEVWDCCYSVAQGIHSGSTPDNTGGAVLYYSLPVKEPPLEWGHVQQTMQYGGTWFFKLA